MNTKKYLVMYPLILIAAFIAILLTEYGLHGFEKFYPGSALKGSIICTVICAIVLALEKKYRR